MQYVNSSIRAIFLFSITFCVNTFAFQGEPYEKLNYRKNCGSGQNKVESSFSHNENDEEGEKSLLSTEERNRRDAKGAAQGFAIGTGMGAGFWAAAHTGAGLSNLVVTTIATAKGTAVATSAIVAGPGLITLGCLALLGCSIGTAYGYATSE